MTSMTRANTSIAACALTACALLSGCGMTPSQRVTRTSPVTPVRVITGHVHGGQQPVYGAVVQLYAVGNQGMKSVATPLVTSTVTTAHDGSFTLTGLWNCNDAATYGADPLIYALSSGGDPGIGRQNQAIQLMAALGRCSTVNASTNIFLDEVTTVASVYALAPFMSDAMHVGAPAAKMAALENAFATVRTLANTSSGTSPGPGVVDGETVPVEEINTLANIVAACVNSAGDDPCTKLFASTTPSGGAAPQDIVVALLNIAAAPLRNTSDLFLQEWSEAPFQPTLKSAPADWTMMLRFTGGGLSGPAGIAMDASGNAWIANASGAGITGLSNQGTRLTGDSGYGTDTIFGAQGVAVDRSGNVWIADTLLGRVFRLTVANSAVTASQSFATGFVGPVSLAVDAQNHVWVADFAAPALIELSNDGTPIGSPLTANGTLRAPLGVAIDNAGRAWVSDNAGQTIAVYSAAQTLESGAGYSDSATQAPAGLAVDPAGHVWVANNGASAISVLGSDGADALSPITGGGLTLPVAVAIDGAGTAWIVNGASSGTLTQATATGTAAGGLGSLSNPSAVAVDSSGNVWTANTDDDSVSKFVGLAAPVVTPLAANVGP